MTPRNPRDRARSTASAATSAAGPLRSLDSATFRASPLYEIVDPNRITRAERRSLGSFRPGAGGAILRPRAANALTLKVAGPDTVALLATLRRAGRLPGRVRDAFDESTNLEIAKLVLDGVLQIRDGRSYVTAAAAHDVVFAPRIVPAPANRLSQLSHDAIRHGETLDIDETLTLSARLYFYNRAPLTPFWRQRLPDRRSVEALLGLHRRGPTTMVLEAGWHRHRESEAWLSWSRRSRRRATTNPPWKLYVSPTCDALRETFDTTVRVLKEYTADAFKVGADLNGLLRPDKLVIYFRDRTALFAAANALAAELRGVPDQGVPFTGVLAGSPLLSWGVDPPLEENLPSWRESESWRLWVTNRVALYLLTAKQTRRPSLPPWQFALDRLRLDGVDIDSWAPDLTS